VVQGIKHLASMRPSSKPSTIKKERNKEKEIIKKKKRKHMSRHICTVDIKFCRLQAVI
jgi:hypothetical protein